MNEPQQPERLTKNEALLEAVRLLLDHELVDVRGVTIYLTKKHERSESNRNPTHSDREE